MNIANVVTNRLIRYHVIVAHIPQLKKGKAGIAQKEAQQEAVASWLKSASKVVLLNRPKDVEHLSVKGAIFDERFSNCGEMPAPTAKNLLDVLVAECPNDGFGVIPVGNAVLNPDGCKTMNTVRLASQLSKAWACVGFAPVVHGEEAVGECVGAYWISRQVAKYISETGKNHPMASDLKEMTEWLGVELYAKVLGHRYFDASHYKLVTVKSVGGEVPVYTIKRPFTKH